mmetsp:Transcript_48895/g.87927  ORF Transcript_48895/g.87927 Transcript_48895/m.87927 type:complete len:277 (+) Transcript_48895:144-974(+)
MCSKLCELNNVLAGILGFGSSIMATMVCLTARQTVVKEMANTGDGSGMAELANGMVIQMHVSALINGFGCVCLCLSTFDCVLAQKHGCVHSITSSTTFCLLRVQLVLTQFLSAGLAGVGLLTYICQMGSTTVFHAQEVIWEIGNFTLTGIDPFDPYRSGDSKLAQAADTPIISLANTIQHLDLAAVCPDSRAMTQAMGVFFLACLVSVVSQVLMAIALNGEKERVAVHEQHETSGMTRDMHESMNLLGSTGSAMQASATQGFHNAYDQYSQGARGH